MENKKIKEKTTSPRDTSYETKKVVVKIVIYILLILWALIVLFPFYWMILSSLKSTASYNGELVPKLYTANPVIENYLSVWKRKDINLGVEMFNTLFFSLFTTALMVFVSILAAFAFSRLEFKGKNLVFTLFLAMMMIPNELVIITNYHTADALGWTNSFVGLILPSTLSVFYIYLLRQNFMQIPDTLYYAAKVDGLSDFRYLQKVMIPLTKPTIISIIILKLIECWNSYVWPRAINDLPEYFVVSQGIIAVSNGSGRIDVPAMMAAVTTVSIPLLVLFIIFRKQIMTGVSKTGTKG